MNKTAIRALQNLRFVSNLTETIDFKIFCKGDKSKIGHYSIAIAKKRATAVSQKSLTAQKRTHTYANLKAYSLYINPLAFFDFHFMLAAGCVVLVAIIEKKLADNGIIGPAAALSAVLRLALPIVGLVSILYLISQIGVFI